MKILFVYIVISLPASKYMAWNLRYIAVMIMDLYLPIATCSSQMSNSAQVATKLTQTLNTLQKELQELKKQEAQHVMYILKVRKNVHIYMYIDAL